MLGSPARPAPRSAALPGYAERSPWSDGSERVCRSWRRPRRELGLALVSPALPARGASSRGPPLLSHGVCRGLHLWRVRARAHRGRARIRGFPWWAPWSARMRGSGAANARFWAPAHAGRHTSYDIWTRVRKEQPMTMTDTPRLDEAALEQFVHQAVGDLAAAISGLMVHLGDRLGLYRAMAGAGPVTPSALAARTGTQERYVQEWLANQAAGGFVSLRPRRRHLRAERRARDGARRRDQPGLPGRRVRDHRLVLHRP